MGARIAEAGSHLKGGEVSEELGVVVGKKGVAWFFSLWWNGSGCVGCHRGGESRANITLHSSRQITRTHALTGKSRELGEQS